jgi:hypothetical protein
MLNCYFALSNSKIWTGILLEDRVFVYPKQKALVSRISKHWASYRQPAAPSVINRSQR